MFPVDAGCAMATQKILEEQLDPSYEPTPKGKICTSFLWPVLFVLVYTWRICSANIVYTASRGRRVRGVAGSGCWA